MTTKTQAQVNLDSINQSNNFIAYAKKSLNNDIAQSKKLTIESITSVVCLSVSLYINNDSASEYSILKKDSTDISESKLRTRILDSIFTIKQKEELQDSQGRVIYNKIKAGLIIFNKDFNDLLKLWDSARKNNGDSEFIKSVRSLVESYGSMTKILKLNKATAESNESESDSQDETQENESIQKSLYNKVNTDFNHILNLLEKAESLDADLLNMITTNIKKISGVVANHHKKEFSKTA